MKVDKEFQSVMFKQRPDAYRRLEESILAEGCRDALLVWNGILIDGYNRYKICQEHDIKYDIEDTTLEFESRDEVKQWIRGNQLARRNLTKEQRNYLIGVDYKEKKKSHGGDRKSSRHFDDLKKTTTKIAEKQKISPKTVERAEKFAEAVDTIAENVGADARDQILSRDVKATAKDVKKLAKMDGNSQKKAMSKAQSGKKLKDAIKETDKENQETEREELAEKASKVALPDKVSLYHGTFLDVSDKIDDASVDLILTDPPYAKKYLSVWEELSQFADKKLKRGGFLVTYSGQTYLPTVMQSLSEHLEYYWTFCLLHKGSNQLINHRNVFCAWKPILVYFKKPMQLLDDYSEDVIKGSGRDKNLHDWQQSEQELSSLIDGFSKPTDIICDPCVGSGTVICAALKKDRYVIGIDKEKSNLNLIRGRLNQMQKGDE